MYMSREFLPDQMPDKYSFGYGVGVTLFSWLEASYCPTLLWMEKHVDGKVKHAFYNEDRRLNVKVRPLKEGRWWPALAFGMDDVGRLDRIKDGKNLNNYFQNLYVVGSKHFDTGGYELGAHLAYRYYVTDVNRKRRGMAGGVTVRPSFYRPLRATVEWDGKGVNAGVDMLLWHHLFAQCALVHGSSFMGILSYHYTMPF